MSHKAFREATPHMLLNAAAITAVCQAIAELWIYLGPSAAPPLQSGSTHRKQNGLMAWDYGRRKCT